MKIIDIDPHEECRFFHAWGTFVFKNDDHWCGIRYQNDDCDFFEDMYFSPRNSIESCVFYFPAGKEMIPEDYMGDDYVEIIEEYFYHGVDDPHEYELLFIKLATESSFDMNIPKYHKTIQDFIDWVVEFADDEDSFRKNLEGHLNKHKEEAA